MEVRLSDIADEAYLKHVWKKQVRRAIRGMTLSGFNLAPDPLHYAGYEWGLDAFLSKLSRDLLLGQYSPERGEIVRMAKMRGLSRPLCFLATRDALVYRAITWRVRPELLSKTSSWVGVDRSDKGTPGQAAAGGQSFDWFQFWLARQGKINEMIEQDEVSYIVESDIANFFPSVRMEALREHLHSQTSLQKELVRLCVQIIDGVMPRQDYSEVSLMGLPQEIVGSSRELAHSLLIHVDEEFDQEGRAGRYSRYMDDVMFAVGTVEEGERIVARLQRSLETLGLYPNAAKTKIFTVEEYLTDSMAGTNADLDRLESLLSEVSETDDSLWRQTVEEVQRAASDHRTVENRPRRWGRVTRRFYTLQRRLGLTDWSASWYADVRDDPGAAASILEYVRSFPLTDDVIRDLDKLATEFSSLYMDLPLLLAETLLTAPSPEDPELWRLSHELAFRRFSGLLEQGARDPKQCRLASAWLVCAWKFSSIRQRSTLLDLLDESADSASPLRGQALSLLAAAGRSLTEWVSAKPGLAWSDALAAEYLQALATGEDRAVGVALSLLEPVKRLSPQRHMIPPRAMPLLEIVARSRPDRLKATLPRMLEKLADNPIRLRDHRSERLFLNALSIAEGRDEAPLL